MPHPHNLKRDSSGPTHYVTHIEHELDVTPPDEWKAHYPAMASIFADFLARRLGA